LQIGIGIMLIEADDELRTVDAVVSLEALRVGGYEAASGRRYNGRTQNDSYARFHDCPLEPQHYNRALAHDPEKWEPVFPRDKRGTRLRGDHAPTKAGNIVPLSHAMI
jgi:hypothetical protein